MIDGWITEDKNFEFIRTPRPIRMSCFTVLSCSSLDVPAEMLYLTAKIFCDRFYIFYVVALSRTERNSQMFHSPGVIVTNVCGEMTFNLFHETARCLAIDGIHRPLP